jgi:predicted amidohydrolase YtcJ
MKTGHELYYGGTVITADSSNPMAEAVAVADGTIKLVGSEKECRSALGAGYEPVDLKGGALLPGFYDCHIHPLPTVFYAINADLLGASSLEDLLARLRASAAEKGAGATIVGCNFDEQAMDVRRLPTRHDLDRVSTDRPVVIIKHDGHSVIANTKALEMAEITKATPDPQAGVIDRDEHGVPLGIFREAAVPLVLNHMPLPDEQELTRGAKKAFEGMLKYGITSLGCVLQTDENGPGGELGALEIPFMQLLRPVIPQSLYHFILAKDAGIVTEQMTSALHDPSPGSNTRVGGLKIISDGSFGTSTAAMYEPFSDQPDKKGFMLFQEEALHELISAAHKAGMQVAIHAIGDFANSLCIGIFEKVLKAGPRRDHRHRIEHAAIMGPKELRRASSLGLLMSVQPMFIHSEKHWLAGRLGEARLKRTYPFRSMLMAGLRLCGSSDSPVEKQDIMHAIECCVTREGLVPSESIRLHDAIEMFTINAAYAHFEEGVRGSITAGKKADLVVLEQNPFVVKGSELHSIKVVKTIVGGEILYSA